MNRLLLAVAACVLALTASAEPLNPLFTSDNFWTQKREDFMQGGAEKLSSERPSSAKDSARTT